MFFKHSKIKGICVFLEWKSTRDRVGMLTKHDARFHFEYELKYLKSRRSIPLGPEMPLTKRFFESDTLFVPFADRIPSRENPAYVDYCNATGIEESETDAFILLSTIAHRGPSSFIFEPIYDDDFTSDDLLNFRKSLGLSVKEFAAVFDLSPAAITRVERKQSSGREVLKRVEIYARYPLVALNQMKHTGGILHTKKRETVENWLWRRVKEEEKPK